MSNDIRYAGYSNPGYGILTVTPSDTVDLTTPARCLYVGTAGNVSVVAEDGSVGLHKNVQAGSFLPVRTKRVNLTGTTAADILAYV